MLASQPHTVPTMAVTLPIDPAELERRDASGFRIFSAGETGSAHDMAHRMLDAGDFARGRRLLGGWLETHRGSGSEWIHLQWHMGVFELGLGYWDAAYARFRREILPAAATSDAALTDAPSMLWRLKLAATKPAKLPWGAVHATALARMRRPSDPYIELHNLLALAGAGDTHNLDRWLLKAASDEMPRRKRLVVRMAIGLRALAAGDYRHARRVVGDVVHHIAEIGGSRGQNLLFGDIERACLALEGALSPTEMG